MDIRIPARLARLNILQGVMGGHSMAPASREMSRWFAELPAEKPQVVIDSLAQRVSEITHSTVAAGKRFRQLEQLLGYADPILKELERQLDQCRLPLDSNSKQAAAGADKLLKQLAEAYVQVVQAIEASMLQRHLHSKFIGLGLLRAAQLVDRRAQVDHRAHSPGSPRRWKLLRKLLFMARKQGLINHAADPHSPDTIELVILRSSLVALCDPSNLESGELSRVRFYIERFAHLVTLGSEAPPAHERMTGLFVFSDSPRGPTQLRADQELESRELLLDVRPLLERAQSQLAGLRQGLHATKLGLPMVANEASYAFMLARCIEQWSEAKARRQLRSDAQPLAELVSGFDPVRQFLTSAVVQRNQNKRRISVMNEWRIVDQSRTGFGLRQASPHTRPIAVGDLVVMQPMERDKPHVCVVRRSRMHEGKEHEVSIERLAGTALAISVDKTLPDGHTHAIPVLMLPRVQCMDGAPGLLAPVGDLKRGMRVTVEQREGNLHYEIMDIFERLASCEMFALRRV